MHVSSAHTLVEVHILLSSYAVVSQPVLALWLAGPRAVSLCRRGSATARYRLRTTFQSLNFEQVVQVFAAAWFDRNLLEWTDFGNLAKTGREGRVWTRVAVDSRRIWADLGVSRTQEQIDQEAEAGRAPVWPRQ